MRTQLGAVDHGTVGHERVLLELPRPRNHDVATHSGARGREAAGVLDGLSRHHAPRTGARDGVDGTRSRTRDGVATGCAVDHRGHLLPRSVMGPAMDMDAAYEVAGQRGNWFFATFLSRRESHALPPRRLLGAPETAT